MKRRIFFQKVSIGFLGLSILPLSKLFAEDRSPLFIPVRFQNEHIRHGLLQYHKTDGDTACPWLVDIRKDIFLSNGLKEQDERFVHYMIQTRSSFIGFGLKDKSVFLDIDGKPNNVIPEEWISLKKHNLIFREFDKKTELIQNIGLDSIVLPVSGNVTIGDKQITADTAAYFNSIPNNTTLFAEKGSQVLIIKSIQKF